MTGSGSVRFSELFADTLQCFGCLDAKHYYCEKHGMQEWEFWFWYDRAINAEWATPLID